MRVLLKWNNRNDPSVIVRLYRTDTIIPNDQLTNPIATLAWDATEYVDVNVVHGNTYYYTWETDDGTDKLYSTNIKVICEFDNGPGPRDLLLGNSVLGYFGTIKEDVFIKAAELSALLGAQPRGTTLRDWHKFIRKGKIIYVPSWSIVTGTTPEALYNHGLVFAGPGPGPWKPDPAMDGVEQGRLFNKFGCTFIVRLPTGVGDIYSNGFVAPANVTEQARRDSEIADLIYPIQGSGVPPSQKLARIKPASSFSSIHNGKFFASATGFNQGKMMWGGYANSSSSGSIIERVGTPLAKETLIDWIPVLELIPNVIVDSGVAL